MLLSDVFAIAGNTIMPASYQTAVFRASPEWRVPTVRPARRASAAPFGMAGAQRAPLVAELITSEAGFAALEPEWTRLAAAVPDAFLAQGFAWCWAGWRTTAQPRGRRLAIFTVREGGRLVLVWPMARVWRGLCAELIPLGSEATDYNPLLVAPSPRAGAYVRAALAMIRQEARGGLVAVPLLRADHPAAGVIAMAPKVLARDVLPAPHIEIGGPAGIAAYEQAMSKNLRRGIERRRRRLEELGTVRFEVITDPSEFAALLDWTIAAKAKWLREHALQSPFLEDPHYREFWLDMQRAGGTDRQVCGIALKLDGKTIAAKVVALTPSRLEGFLTTFDAEFARFSPGQILLLDSLRWCAQNGLDYDFRIGDEAYKWDWTDCSVKVTSYVLPLGRAGQLLDRTRVLRAALRAAKDRLREKVPCTLRQYVKGLRDRIGLR
jgi:CelD/BcsL family acetyltransferase involved in cellulose biosynthesis